MEFDNGKSLILGINKEGDLVQLELNFNDLNKGTRFYDPHYYLTPHGYTDIKDEETGEREAKERLKEREYWDDIGLIEKDSFLNDFINFDDVAEHVLKHDGWEMTNGEFYFFGFYEDKNYYLNLNWIGFEEKSFSRDNFKKIYISEEDFLFLSNNSEAKESEEDKIRQIKTIFSKYQDKNEIIKDLIEEKQNN